MFVTQYDSEGYDGSLELEGNQDALVAAVAKANPQDDRRRSKAAARCSCRGSRRSPRSSKPSTPASAAARRSRESLPARSILPATCRSAFPASAGQLAHPVLAGLGMPDGTPAHITYDEGAAIGYKWYDVKGYRPLFAFGHGLSYTQLRSVRPRRPAGWRGLQVSFSIRNVGKRAGKGVAQVYVAPADWKKAGWEAPKRLGAFAKTDLKPGQSKSIEVTVDPRLLATYEAAGNNWHIRCGRLSPDARHASDLPAEAVSSVLARRQSGALLWPRIEVDVRRFDREDGNTSPRDFCAGARPVCSRRSISSGHGQRIWLRGRRARDRSGDEILLRIPTASSRRSEQPAQRRDRDPELHQDAWLGRGAKGGRGGLCR